jgi:hypothetical protein
LEWLGVLKCAQFSHDLWQLGFFDNEAERLIRNGLERISHEPKLPVGGDAEAAQARRLLRLAAKLKGSRDWLPPHTRGMLIQLAKKYQELQGGYYIFKALREPQLLKWHEYLTRAHDHADVEVKRACETMLLGLPQTDQRLLPEGALCDEPAEWDAGAAGDDSQHPRGQLGPGGAAVVHVCATVEVPGMVAEQDFGGELERGESGSCRRCTRT